MNIVYIVLFLLLISLFVFHILKKRNLFEPMENNDTCETESKTLIYKNAGTIQALQDKVQELMKQVNQLIINDDKQTSEIQKIQGLETKYDSLAEKADELAMENKERLIEMAKQSKAKMDEAQKQSDKIKFS